MMESRFTTSFRSRYQSKYGSGVGGAGGFLPISNDLQLWLDASDLSTITSSGGAVSAWADKSGNGNNATQPVGANQPATGATTRNGRNVIDFGGSPEELRLPSALFTISQGANTLFIVSKRNTETGSEERILAMGQNGVGIKYGLRYSATSGSILFLNNNAAGNVLTSTGHTNTDFQIIKGRRSGTTQAISVNGATEDTNTNGDDTTGVDLARIGSLFGASYLIGSVAEVLIYNRSLSDAESDVIERYLSAKWGVTLA